MAEVTFIGLGNTGFPDPNVQILPGARPSQAEVNFFGTNEGPSPTGAINTISELVPDAPLAEFTQVDFFEQPAFIPASENPNINDLIFIISGGPTMGALAVDVLVVPAVIPQSDGRILQGSPVADDLRLFAGPHAPSGLVGKIVKFIQPTGVDNYAAILGVTGMITMVGEPTGVVSAPTGVSVIFDAPLNVQPTNGDRFVITSDDRSLRRSPIIEVILE